MKTVVPGIFADFDKVVKEFEGKLKSNFDE